MDTPELIYKVIAKTAWSAAQPLGVFHGAPVDVADGYVHFSTAAQLGETLSRHFVGQSELVLLAVPTETLADKLKWEVSRGGALFPHLYASLPVDAVAWEAPIAVGADGSCALPEAVR